MITKLVKYLFTPVLALAVLSVFSMVNADDWSKLSEKKQTKLGLYMTAEQSYKYTMDNMNKTLFVDIRTPSELSFLGVPSVMDAHVPWVLLDTSHWNDKKGNYEEVANKDFVADMDNALKKKGLSKTDTVILICRSGNRSAKAANTLAENGYTSVYTVVDGYEGDKVKEGENKGKRMANGWKNAGLPWTYTLDKDYMYLTK